MENIAGTGWGEAGRPGGPDTQTAVQSPQQATRSHFQHQSNSVKESSINEMFYKPGRRLSSAGHGQTSGDRCGTQHVIVTPCWLICCSFQTNNIVWRLTSQQQPEGLDQSLRQLNSVGLLPDKCFRSSNRFKY